VSPIFSSSGDVTGFCAMTGTDNSTNAAPSEKGNVFIVVPVGIPEGGGWQRPETNESG
jgi:hypothetical protein